MKSSNPVSYEIDLQKCFREFDQIQGFPNSEDELNVAFQQAKVGRKFKLRAGLIVGVSALLGLHFTQMVPVLGKNKALVVLGMGLLGVYHACLRLSSGEEYTTLKQKMIEKYQDHLNKNCPRLLTYQSREYSLVVSLLPYLINHFWKSKAVRFPLKDRYNGRKQVWKANRPGNVP